MESFLSFPARGHQESITAYLTRNRTVLQQFVGSINEHAQQEHTILVAQANQQYRKSQLSTLWKAMGTGERDEYDATHLIAPPTL